MNHRLRSLLIILAVVALDWSSKIYIRNHVGPADVVPVIPGFFNIVHAENPGAAFSMFAEAPSRTRSILLIGVSSAVMLIVGSMLWRNPSPAVVENPLLRLGLALVFGGALGNLWDRAFRGTVTDFVQLFFGSYEFASFNVADSAITVGTALLILDLLMTRKKA